MPSTEIPNDKPSSRMRLATDEDLERSSVPSGP
jgi:hypothetical protein